MTKFFVLWMGAAVLAGTGMAAQTSAVSLQGVWQTVEITIASQPPRVITIPQPGPYLTIFTAKHYSRTEVQSETPRPAIADVAKATADELRTTWGPFVAEAGTYELNGSIATMHPMASKNPVAMASGAFIVYNCKLEGETLTLVQVRNQSGPYPTPVTFKLVRVE